MTFKLAFIDRCDSKTERRHHNKKHKRMMIDPDDIKARKRFERIIYTTDSMTEDKMLYLCFDASDEEFEAEMEKLKN